MGKFRVGDRVRCVAHSDWGSKGEVGEIYTVTDILKSGDVELDGSGSGVMTSRFELANASPVRTVTRREIETGRYGKLELFDDYSAEMTDWSDAEACRSAAHIFNEIADVLDEQKEAA